MTRSWGRYAKQKQVAHVDTKVLHFRSHKMELGRNRYRVLKSLNFPQTKDFQPFFYVIVCVWVGGHNY